MGQNIPIGDKNGIGSHWKFSNYNRYVFVSKF